MIIWSWSTWKARRWPHRLKKGPLPPEQLLEYAIQIADALDTAHRHGVVHRDLKPGNIMLDEVRREAAGFRAGESAGRRGGTQA